MKNRFLIVVMSVFVLLAASPAKAALTQDGIFGCNMTGSYAMSVGSLGAIGGSAVPVTDSAVTLNTGYLVYKECVLRPLVDKLAQSAISAYSNAELIAFSKGNNGNPYFVQNFNQEQFLAGNDAYNRAFNTVVGSVNTAFQGQVQTALARNYAMSTVAPDMSLSCPYVGDLGAVYRNQATNWAGLFALANPSCDPIYSYMAAQDQLGASAAAAESAWLTQANWGRGVYPITDPNTGLVVTPGFLVGDIASMAVTAGQRRLENVDDIGQMVAPLMVGMANRILSPGCGGLMSLGDPACGQPPYLDQVRQQVGQGLQTSLTNVALTTLAPALAVEQAYNSAQNSLASILTQSITQLRGAEKTCWSKIIPLICSTSSLTTSTSTSMTCTASSGGATLRIATSTAFSQAIIDSQIKPLADAVAQNVQTSNQSIQAIQTLIANVQNTTNTSAQQAALQQLDSLVSRGVLHNQNDVTAAQQTVTDLQNQLSNSNTGLLSQTFKTWTGDGTDAYGSVVSGAVAWNGSSQGGWCNASTRTPGGPATIQMWITKWSS